jgi:hypothetical protein
MAVDLPWLHTCEVPQASGRVYLHLKCGDCLGEIRLVKSLFGEAQAARMVAEHKPSGCCAERQAVRPAEA